MNLFDVVKVHILYMTSSIEVMLSCSSTQTTDPDQLHFQLNPCLHMLNNTDHICVYEMTPIPFNPLLFGASR